MRPVPLPPERVTTLLLSRRDLTAVPENVRKHTSLRELNISHNKVTELPLFLSALPQLRSLMCSSNLLACFPDQILDMPWLQELSLAHNPICHVPSPLSRLFLLQRLSLNDCRLESLPRSLFCNMLQLHSLDLSSNHLKELPSVLPLAQLNFFSIARNQFAVLPSELLRLRSQCKGGITYDVLYNPFLSNSSPLLDKLGVHVASLRDLALTACLKAVKYIAKLQRMLPLDIAETLTATFAVCDGRTCSNGFFGRRYTATMLQAIEHVLTPFECKFCCYNCVPKKISQPIERAEQKKKREAEKEKKIAEKKEKFKSKKARIRRDDSPVRRIL